MNTSISSKDSVSPSLEGRREMSVGCDDERFISLKEYCEASYRGGSPSSLTKSELAQLYFPGAPRSSALRLLHKYITSAHGLLTALAGALGVASCTKEEAPSNSPRGEDSIIAANIMHCQYENALISRDV